MVLGWEREKYGFCCLVLGWVYICCCLVLELIDLWSRCAKLF